MEAAQQAGPRNFARAAVDAEHLLRGANPPGHTPPRFASLPRPPRGPRRRQEDLGPDLPPDGKAELAFSPNGGLEFRLAGPRGFTAAEQILLDDLLAPPFDPDAAGSFTSEFFRDGRRLRFDGPEVRTYSDIQGLALKIYNHTDSRGTVGRVELKESKPIDCTYRELMAWIAARPPLGRDPRLEALTSMVRDNSVGLVDVKRAVKRQDRRLDDLEKLLKRIDNSLAVRDGKPERTPSPFVRGAEADWAIAPVERRQTRTRTSP